MGWPMKIVCFVLSFYLFCLQVCFKLVMAHRRPQRKSNSHRHRSLSGPVPGRLQRSDSLVQFTDSLQTKSCPDSPGSDRNNNSAASRRRRITFRINKSFSAMRMRQMTPPPEVSVQSSRVNQTQPSQAPEVSRAEKSVVDRVRSVPESGRGQSLISDLRLKRRSLKAKSMNHLFQARARTFSESMEENDQVMPLPRISKQSRWKSTTTSMLKLTSRAGCGSHRMAANSSPHQPHPPSQIGEWEWRVLKQHSTWPHLDHDTIHSDSQ